VLSDVVRAKPREGSLERTRHQSRPLNANALIPVLEYADSAHAETTLSETTLDAADAK
jgi:hypothetical protein